METSPLIDAVHGQGSTQSQPEFYFPHKSYHHYACQSLPKTQIEQTYLSLLSEILGKPLWWEKMKHPAIMAKWKEEMKEPLASTVFENSDCRAGKETEEVVESILKFWEKELEYFAENRMRTMTSREGTEWRLWGLVPAGAFISDDVSPASLRESFLKHIAAAESEAKQLGRWHPHSNETVLDIFHPSNYPVVYGETRYSMLPDALVGDTVLSLPDLASDVDRSDTSFNFQLLPSVFRVDNDGKVTIKSYINNLNPWKHGKLYGNIAGIFERMLPMLEMSAGRFKETELPCRLENFMYWERSPVFPDFKEVVDDVYRKQDFDAMEEKKRVSLRGRDLRVIVKAASIRLTPENARYNGGSWHLEGTDNEAIMMTGIYYYDMDNITSSRIEFREGFDDCKLLYPQDEHDDIMTAYFIRPNDWAVQQCGHVPTRSGRVVAFPNSSQHRVPSFKLDDPSREGYRNMLVFFVCDPDKKVPSTLEVPPQQRTWVSERIFRAFGERIPMECVDRIVKHLPGVKGDQEDKEVGLELLKERSRQFWYPQRKYLEVSLCEH
ncbi:hypothetical protein HDU97_005294 [Phlyctochytrium planicorne]|nr:hypothetical protein HDU97_005294 [Phlyctochytrium planicorne]